MTRVDCLASTHAVEFDFAEKWAESIGQALHYSYMTGKAAKVVLILEKPEKQICYYKRVQNLGKIHNFDVEYITPDILTVENNKCQFHDCKCHKIKNKKHKFFNRIKYFLQKQVGQTAPDNRNKPLLRGTMTIHVTKQSI